MPRFKYLVMLFFAASVEQDVSGADWPQYRGIHRDGISAETSLLNQWPERGPDVLWRIPVGEGYSGISVSNGKLYTMDAHNEDEFVVCIEVATGKELWRFRADTKFINDQGNGPRATPTVEGDRVYGVSAQGKLHALNATNGELLWSVDLRRDLEGKMPIWGFSSSPLVEESLLIVPVGGAEGNAVVALDKNTGKVVWRSQTDEPGYSSPIAVTAHGVRQIIAFTGSSLFSLSPTDGKLFWRYAWKTRYFVNSATPMFLPGNRIFISSSYDSGAALIEIKKKEDGLSVEEVWLTKKMKNHFNSSVRWKGHLYGFDNAVLKCIEESTGLEKWKKTGFGKGSLIVADDHLIVLSERGLLALIEATPERYREKASIQILQGRCWSMPSLADGILYLRNQKEMAALSFR